MLMGVSLFLVTGCGGGEEATGHKDDETPGGEANQMDDMSPESLQDMENVGENPN
jgi:hypothetical protein